MTTLSDLIDNLDHYKDIPEGQYDYIVEDGLHVFYESAPMKSHNLVGEFSNARYDVDRLEHDFDGSDFKVSRIGDMVSLTYSEEPGCNEDSETNRIAEVHSFVELAPGRLDSLKSDTDEYRK